MKHPGTILKARFLDPLGITAYELARGMGVQQTRVSQILHGKRSITPDTAVRLGAFFGVPARWFMDLQTQYDLDRAASAATGISKHPGRYWVRPSGAVPLGAAPKAEPTTIDVDPELRERLRRAAALTSSRTRREVEQRVYDDGSRAITGKSDP